MAEYEINTSYEINGNGSIINVGFDLVPGESELSGQNKETLVAVVAQAIADALETVVVNTPNATLDGTTGVRYYAATETLNLV